MAFIHRYRNLDCTTFQELQEKYLAIMLTTKPTNWTASSVVGDRYDVDCSKSLKLKEHLKRDNSAGLRKNIRHSGQTVHSTLEKLHRKQCRQSSSPEFHWRIVDGKCSLTPTRIQTNSGWMVKDPGKAVLLTTTEIAVVPELSCSSHEDADTRIFCHLLINYTPFNTVDIRELWSKRRTRISHSWQSTTLCTSTDSELRN